MNNTINRSIKKISVGPIWAAQMQTNSIWPYLISVWSTRNLFFFFANKSLFQIFRRTFLGIGWMVIQPLALAIPAIFFMQNVLGITSDLLPMPLFILLGLSLWIYIRRGVHWMTKSPLMHRSVLSRAYVPFLLPMTASLIPAFFEFLVVLFLAVILSIYYIFSNVIIPFELGLHNLTIIAAFFLATLLAISISCFTSILNLRAQDTWLTMRYVMSFWMLASAVFYPIEAIPADWLNFALLNPLLTVLELFRAGFTGHFSINIYYIILTVIQIFILLFLGLRFFIIKQYIIFEKN
jgi:lipopolysaccharide transport system permease protein